MESQDEIEFFISMAWYFMLFLTFIIIGYIFMYRSRFLKLEKEKQIAAFRAAVDAEEKQKEDIADLIHHEIIHLLTAAGHHLEINKSDSQQKAAVLLNEAITSLKAIAIDLVPKTLSNFGLINALKQQAILLNTNDDCVIEIEDNIKQSAARFSKSDQVTIYRMCLEILNNLQKHTHFTYLRITADSLQGYLIFDFTHNGIGVTNEQIDVLREKSTGMGLKSLHSRLLLLSANIVYSKDFETSTIKLSIPYPNEQ